MELRRSIASRMRRFRHLLAEGRMSLLFRASIRTLKQDAILRSAFIVATLLPPAIIGWSVVVMPLQRFTVREVKPVRDNAESRSDPTRQRLLQQIASAGQETAFLSSRLELAVTDSFYLGVDLSDSVLILEIRGVAVRSCSIRSCKRSGLFAKMPAGELNRMLSAPFTADGSVCTIPKKAIVVKKAPKDSVEAQKFSGLPPPKDTTPVRLSYFFGDGLSLSITPAERRIEANAWSFFMRRKLMEMRYIVRSLLHLRFPHLVLWIELILANEDARAIYRALPRKAGMALKM